ncbi:adenylate/guanylate cyclase domain-containing protein [Reyranella sp.]|uniref:adenylate/guanylate cyclase domain-containing protein n=1 Tax=Reyranella sp. TaxID=1929291 RepID=UPI003D139D45
MSPTPGAVAARPIRWGLATRLFAILLLLGAVAVLATGVLGYMRARDALQESIYNQLTTVRKSKARQIETYFRTIRNELSQLAAAKMTVEAARAFHITFDELEQSDVPFELRRKVGGWYEAGFLRELDRETGKKLNVADYLPTGPAAYYLQYHYIVNNPHPRGWRRLVDDAGDDSAYTKQHAIFHPLMRAAANGFSFFDVLLADPKSGRLVYTVRKEVDFATSLRTGPYRRSNVAAAVARCATSADRSAVCFEDFAPYAPSRGAPTAFMAAPVIDQGVVVAVLVAHLSIDEIDNVVTGDRRWREEGFGATGEAYLVGPDHLARSGLRAFYEDPPQYFAELKSGGESDEDIDAIRRFGTPIMHQHVKTEASRAALAGLEGTGEITGYQGIPILASWGPLAIPGTKWALIAKIDAAEAFAPVYRLQLDLMIAGALALLVVILTGAWLSRALLAPLRELTDGVTRFAGGDYGAKVTVRTRDEVGALCAAFNGMVEEIHAKNIVIENKNRENEELLLNVLPAPIASRLRGGEKRIADGFTEVSVAFADLVGFTAMSSAMAPDDLVSLLNGLFTRFDVAAQEIGIEKIKTVGDSYMAVCGMPEPVANHAERMVRMAIRMVHITREHALEHHVSMSLRVGINSGPVVAGVIGKSKYIYDLWGDTVNLASRMESNGMPDSIQVTRRVYEMLKDEFVFEPRGEIEVKGKGRVEAWLLKV